MQVLAVLPAEGAAVAPRLRLQVPRQAGGGGERLLDLEPGEVGDGQEHVSAEIRVDDGAEGELHLLHRETRRLLPLLPAQHRVIAVHEQQRTALVPALGIENGADVRVERLRPAKERHRRRGPAGCARGRLRRLRRGLAGGGRVLSERLLQLPPERLVVLPCVRRGNPRGARIGGADAAVPLTLGRRGDQHHEQKHHRRPSFGPLGRPLGCFIQIVFRLASRASPGNRKTDATTTIVAPVGSCSIQLR